MLLSDAVTLAHGFAFDPQSTPASVEVEETKTSGSVSVCEEEEEEMQEESREEREVMYGSQLERLVLLA